MHPLDAPGSLWVLSNDGKYLARPLAGETSHKKQLSCGRQEKGPTFLFPYHKGFRLCGGDQGAFRSPPGPLRGPSRYAWVKSSTRNRFLAAGRKRAYLSFSRIAKDFASAEATRGLSDRPLDPFGAHPYIRGRNLPQETDFLRQSGNRPTFLFPHHKGFRLCGGDQRAFRSPFGNLRPLCCK